MKKQTKKLITISEFLRIFSFDFAFVFIRMEKRQQNESAIFISMSILFSGQFNVCYKFSLRKRKRNVRQSEKISKNKLINRMDSSYFLLL